MKREWIVILIAVLCIAGWLVSWYVFGDRWVQMLGDAQSKPDTTQQTEYTADTRETEQQASVSTEDADTTREPLTTEADTEASTQEETGYNGDTFESNGMPYMIKVNRQMNVVTVYTLDAEGYYTVPYKAMVCSVGLRNGTPRGTFKLQSDRYEWRELYGNVYGQYAVRIRKAIMFHSVPYYKPQIDQLESEEYNKLGEAASLGCIRLAIEDIKWIYENCERGTIVQIFDSDYVGPLGKPEPIRLDLDDPRSCCDPTDDDPESLWNVAEEQED